MGSGADRVAETLAEWAASNTDSDFYAGVRGDQPEVPPAEPPAAIVWGVWKWHDSVYDLGPVWDFECAFARESSAIDYLAARDWPAGEGVVAPIPIHGTEPEPEIQ